jgi:rod shape-determining protein MreD
MRGFLSYLLFAYLVLCVQAVFFKGAKPDLVLVLVCYYTLTFGRSKGILFGVAAGLIMDSASGFLLGPNIISKSLAAFFIGSIRENIFHWNVYVNTLLVAFLSIVDALWIYICFGVFSDISFVNRSWSVSVTGILFTVVAALLAYPFLNPQRKSEATF